MNFIFRTYKKLGGAVLLKQWLKGGVLINTIFASLFIGYSKKGLEILRLLIQLKTQNNLRRKYRYVLNRNKGRNFESLIQKHSNKVWICWLQGMENAPRLVKVCFNSIVANLSGKEIIVITSENFRDYVEFPDYVLEKWKKGNITNTHFSDLLRLELLIKYGGLWIDATVLCTSNNIPDYIVNSELFFYQVLKPGRDGHAIGLSSWLISAKSNNKILIITRELLYEYWKKNSMLIDYYLLHSFMQIVLDQYPDDQKRIFKVCNSIPHILLLDIFEEYNGKKYNDVKKMSSFHKLSNKHSLEEVSKKGTFYDVLINQSKWNVNQSQYN